MSVRAGAQVDCPAVQVPAAVMVPTAAITRVRCFRTAPEPENQLGAIVVRVMPGRRLRCCATGRSAGDCLSLDSAAQCAVVAEELGTCAAGVT